MEPGGVTEAMRRANGRGVPNVAGGRGLGNGRTVNHL